MEARRFFSEYISIAFSRRDFGFPRPNGRGGHSIARSDSKSWLCSDYTSVPT